MGRAGETKVGEPVPAWLPILLVIGGSAVMLLALGVIPTDPGKLHAPRWVLLAAGLTFSLAGIVLSIAPIRQERPALYMFSCALLCTTFFLVGAWTALFAEGITGSIGPFIFMGPVADLLGRGLFGLGALLLGFLTAYSWRQWWRALQGKAIDLG